MSKKYDMRAFVQDATPGEGNYYLTWSFKSGRKGGSQFYKTLAEAKKNYTILQGDVGVKSAYLGVEDQKGTHRIAEFNR